MSEHPKFCPHCGVAIADQARTCTGCGKPVGVLPTEPAAAAPVVPAPPAGPTKLSGSARLVLAILGVLVVLSIAIMLTSPAPRAVAPQGPTDIDAFVMCKQFMGDRLKAPSTASFATAADDGVAIRRIDQAQFRVQAYVDAQNSFGAMIRTRYTCLVRHTGGDQWRLESLTTDP